MDPFSAHEVAEKTRSFLEQIQDDIFLYVEKKKNPEIRNQFQTMLASPEYQKLLRSYICLNNIPVDAMALPKGCRKKMKANGYNTLLDFAFIPLSKLSEQLKLNRATVEKIAQFIETYGQMHSSRIHALCEGNTDVLWDDDSLQKRILAIYNTIGFAGLSLQELEENCMLLLQLIWPGSKRFSEN